MLSLSSCRTEFFRSIGLPTTISFIVVGKRHHIRFFPAPGADSRQQDPKNGNLPSGLVVDQQVVHPLYKDFYLQSQKPLMGTSRPAHYTVLHDENAMSQDECVLYTYGHVVKGSPSAIASRGCVLTFATCMVVQRLRYRFPLLFIVGSRPGCRFLQD